MDNHYHFFQINKDNKPWDEVEAFTDNVVHSDAQAGNLARFLSGLYKCEVRIAYAKSKDHACCVGGRYINVN